MNIKMLHKVLKSVLILQCFISIIVLGDEIMGKLKIIVSNKTKDSITRTIRISGKAFDRINSVAESNNISFNNVVNQLIEFGLDNLDEE